jgi:hypothetical protein
MILIQCLEYAFRVDLTPVCRHTGGMEKAIYVPPGMLGHFQNIQHALASAKAYFYCHDTIKKASLPGFIEKWEDKEHHYGLRADAPARAYRKSIGKASVVLCISHEYLDPKVERVGWWMFSTPGKHGLADADIRSPGEVRDARKLPRLTIGDYEFIHAKKRIDRTRSDTTWTWRMTPQRFNEWQAWLVERAKVGDTEKVRSGFEAIRKQPLAAGVRNQVLKLESEANKVLQKNGHSPIHLGDLPIMTRVERKSDQLL